MEIQQKQLLEGTFGVVRHDNGLPLNATFANETFVSADESILTVVPDPADGPDSALIDATGVAEGSTNLHVEVDASYEDPSTGLQVTKHMAADIPVTVTAPPPEETATDLVVNFGPATAPVVTP